MTFSVLFLEIQILRVVRIWYLGIDLFVSIKSKFANIHGNKDVSYCIFRYNQNRHWRFVRIQLAALYASFLFLLKILTLSTPNYQKALRGE